MDRSIKVLLTVIAILLVGVLLRPVAQTPAHADGNNPHGALSTVMFPDNARPDGYVTVLKDGEVYLYLIDTSNHRLSLWDRKVLGAK